MLDVNCCKSTTFLLFTCTIDMDDPSRRFAMFACQIDDSDESLKMLMAYLSIFGNILPCIHIIFLIYQTTDFKIYLG